MNLNTKLQICVQLVLWLWIEAALQDVAAGKNPTSHDSGASVSDANLMFEMLLGGLEMDKDNNIALMDMELASMKSGRTFLSQINDNIPRSRSSMVQMVTELLSHRRKPLTQPQFDNVVLIMVYSAQQSRHQEGEEGQQAWGGVLLQLANVTVRDLRGSYLFNYA